MYRPLLDGANSDWLFPGNTKSAAREAKRLRHAIKLCVLTVGAGREWHPHLFRHLAAMMILTNDPGAHGQVQTILGHKDIATTIKFYAGMEKPAAFRHFGSLVSTLRDEALMPLPKRRSKLPSPRCRGPAHPGEGRVS